MKMKGTARIGTAVYLSALMVVLAPPATAGITDGHDNYAKHLSDYMRAAVSTKWSKARQIRVWNPATVDDTLAVVVQVQGRKGMVFVVVDDSGGSGEPARPIVTQADDLDGNGTVDEVCFLLPLKAKQRRTVTLLSAEAELPAAPSDLLIKAHEAGSWAPVRMQPTRSLGATQHSTYLSPQNAARARKLMARLDEPVPMEVVQCGAFRVLIGKQSGLIEGMRPANIPKGLLGSYLREFVPDQPDMGQMTRHFAGPVRCGFEWLGGQNARRITVYRNGVIESTWTEAPPQVQVIACAYPYQYLQTDPGGAVRYSQMLESRRNLPAVATVGFFGRNDASLRVEANGLTVVDHEVWLDSGEIGWEVGLDAHGKKSSEDTVDRMTRYLRDTYIAGGMHVTSWKGGGNEAALWYRIGNLGDKALAAGSGLVRVTSKKLTQKVPMVKTPEPKPPVSVVLEKTRITVNRLYPSEINGWELRPITLAKRNPQPAYFPAQLVNRSDKEAILSLSLEDADWIHTAKVLSNHEILTYRRFGDLRIPLFRDEAELVPGGVAVAVTVAPGSSVPIEVLIRPKRGTLGLLNCRLRWGDGESTDLEVLVRPTILFMPIYAPVNDVGRELSNVGGPVGSPLTYGVRFWGGYAPELIQWYEAAHRDAERNGFWTFDPIALRGLATEHGEQVAAGHEGIDLTAWTQGVLDVLRDPRFVDYRVRVYTHDEIHEVLGRKGHYVVPFSWMVDVDRRIVMNSPTAAWPSFQEPAIDEPFQYHIKLPNDIAELFYYCGQDARLQEYARKLVEPRRELFDKWRADPDLMANAGTDNPRKPRNLRHPRQIVAFWISTQLHVTKYTSVRRQIWWLRHHGIDAFNSWACSSNYSPYAGRIMHWMLMHIKAASSPNRSIHSHNGQLLTDRALGWIDMKRDMELITLVRLLSEDVDDKTTLRQLEELTRQALDASQRDNFEAARDHYMTALKLLRPDLTYLAPRDLYRGPVKAEPLRDLFAEDDGFIAAQRLPKIQIHLLKKDGPRPKPTVDGILDNAYLEQGVTLELREYTQGSRLKAATTAYVARDEKDLYIFFSCREPNMAKRQTERAKKRDDHVWATDCVEIFIDRTGDAVKLVHMGVSSIGVRYDARKDIGKDWNPEYEVATMLDTESWSAELKIPFASLGGAPEPGETWRMNFCRERHAGAYELGAWSVTLGHFHQPDRFGYVQFN